MKDINIKASRIKKELIIFAVSFIASIGLNIYSIANFKTDWSELISQLHIVFVVSIVIYLLVLIFRLIFIGLNRITKLK